ncbi:2,3-bisphosphoglycerate-independent phosphoglycerate mutase [Carboxylicivirga caseinilyticus]|uniref:2,3-bisphosphoglycerate-independent phosphoglycerate mutase n=1 Tax=Carboxylicivirga caseinilyticus TaxID=3417572 RepID=UPI003D33B1EA|nr:2,3-bisphosphoglycerate-independent phosphoglycerate mutase [Marinilabiliaceae bacterium A049]
MSKKTILVILDGWGFGDKSKSDVISQVETPYWDSLLAKYPYSELQASGENVGLPDGQMGNSEVGHLNIGAGRVVYQDLVKINRACADGSIAENKALSEAYAYAKESGKKVHLLGLMSKGGVHSSQDHIHTLLDVAKSYDLNDVFVHAFMDGRDTDPRSGKGFMTELVDHMAKSTGAVATVTGRYYAMDRDNRWERVKEAYDVMVSGIGSETTNVLDAIQASYDAEVTDEFIKPIVNTTVDGKIEEGDVVVFFNFRNDRAKELTIALTQKDMPEHGMKTIPLHYCTMVPYDATFQGLHILFDKENVKETIGEVVSKAGLKQLRIAETEKYAHVTFFFSGGREAVFEGEDRILVNSPKVATYDLQPEMSAYEVKDKVVAELNNKKYDFICLNFANGDMVGHTGVYEAIEKAVGAVDSCVESVIEAAKANDYEAIIIADHGNADNAVNADGSPNTAHSLNPVPFVWVTEQKGEVSNGVLADVAPSILQLMGVEQPAAMTGKSLIKLS